MMRIIYRKQERGPFRSDLRKKRKWPAELLLLLAIPVSCNPKKNSSVDYYDFLLEQQSLQAQCGPADALIVLNQTLQGGVVQKGWNYYKFQAPTENDAVFTLTPMDTTQDVDLAVGLENQNIGSSLPSQSPCMGWDKCSGNGIGVPEVISGIHLHAGSYRCIGVYGSNCISGSCVFTLNIAWSVKP